MLDAQQMLWVFRGRVLSGVDTPEVLPSMDMAGITSLDAALCHTLPAGRGAATRNK